MLRAAFFCFPAPALMGRGLAAPGGHFEGLRRQKKCSLCNLCIFSLTRVRERKRKFLIIEAATYPTHHHTTISGRPEPVTLHSTRALGPQVRGAGGAGSLLPPPTPHRGFRRGLHFSRCDARKISRKRAGGPRVGVQEPLPAPFRVRGRGAGGTPRGL